MTIRLRHIITIFLLGSTPISAYCRTNFHFPKDFLWGAGTAAHQVEGGNTNNDWYEWENQGHTKDRSGSACDHYRRYEEDLDLVKSLGLNSFRLSLEWSRIEPSENYFSRKEIEHYRDVLTQARARGIQTFVTLHHFTNPVWVAKKSGWQNRQTPFYFERFTKVVVAQLGDLVDFWITVNEPNVNALTSYVAGATPPGLKSSALLAPVLANFLKAHALAYHAIHEKIPNAKVGFAHHMRIFEASRKWYPGDLLLASWVDSFWNTQILDAMRTGKIRFSIPFVMDYKENFPPLAGTLDFIGINYYTRDHIELDFSLPEKMRVLPTAKEALKNDQGWEIYPQGLEEVVMKASEYNLPIYITENGVSDSRDLLRTYFIKSHLVALAHTLQRGADVRGYLYWALIDNFEWVDGFGPRFGLVEVNYNTFSRTPRVSALWWRDWLKKAEF